MMRFLVILPFLFPPIAQASSAPRALTSIDRPFVELKDLFTNTGAKANELVGPGPAPGRKIEVGPNQLAKIAEQFGIEWRQGENFSGVIISRPGRPISQNAIHKALHQALSLAGSPSHFKIIVSNFFQPMIPPAARGNIAVNQLDYNPATSKFRAILVISALGMEPVTLRVEGSLQRTTKVVVAAHSLTPGEVIRSSDVSVKWVSYGGIDSAVTSNPEKLYGMQVNRLVSEDSVISKNMISQPDVILKGNFVTLIVQVPGLNVTAHGVALTSGGKGSVISVLNPTSRDVVQAVVVGHRKARVDPDSVPETSRAAGNSEFVVGGDYYAKWRQE